MTPVGSLSGLSASPGWAGICGILAPCHLLPFAGGRQLHIDISGPTMIGQGAGLHQLWFPVQLDARNTIGGGVSVSLTGQAWIGAARHDYLGPFTTAEAVATFEGQPIPANIVLPVSDEQLAVIEQRQGRSVTVLARHQCRAWL